MRADDADEIRVAPFELIEDQRVEWTMLSPFAHASAAVSG